MAVFWNSIPAKVEFWNKRIGLVTLNDVEWWEVEYVVREAKYGNSVKVTVRDPKELAPLYPLKAGDEIRLRFWKLGIEQLDVVGNILKLTRQSTTILLGIWPLMVPCDPFPAPVKEPSNVG